MEERKMTEGNVAWFYNALANDEKSPATIEKYMRDVAAFSAFAGDDAITKETAVRYKQYLLERYAPASVNSMLAALNRFFKEMGWYDCVVKAIRIQRQAFREKDRELTREEYYRLLKAAKSRGKDRLCLLMQTIASTGIRVSELRFITVEAVRRGSATVSLKGKIRKVLLPRTLAAELRRYAKRHKILSGSVFITKSGRPLDRSNIIHEMKALCRAARVSRRKVFPHNLRHLFACLYYQAERDLSRLADLLGHSNINTTRIYTSLSGAEQQQQIDQLGLIL